MTYNEAITKFERLLINAAAGHFLHSVAATDGGTVFTFWIMPDGRILRHCEIDERDIKPSEELISAIRQRWLTEVVQ
jgi:hypothetical protein